VPKDRREDRHDPDRPGHIWRPDPARLWDDLGRKVGERKRSATISDLVRRYLAGEDMPERPWLTKTNRRADKS
jgi:hypothetical protein